MTKIVDLDVYRKSKEPVWGKSIVEIMNEYNMMLDDECAKLTDKILGKQRRRPLQTGGTNGRR